MTNKPTITQEEFDKKVEERSSRLRALLHPQFTGLKKFTINTLLKQYDIK